MNSPSRAESEHRPVQFVLSSALRDIQRRLIETYGGLPGIRDDNALESAIARPENLSLYGGVTSVPALAAALPWAIVRNHPFADGNKRAALAALLLFVTRNGHRVNCSQAEETAMVLRAAASEITEDEWTTWVQSVVVPR